MFLREKVKSCQRELANFENLTNIEMNFEKKKKHKGSSEEAIKRERERERRGEGGEGRMINDEAGRREKDGRLTDLV